MLRGRTGFWSVGKVKGSPNPVNGSFFAEHDSRWRSLFAQHRLSKSAALLHHLLIGALRIEPQFSQDEPFTSFYRFAHANDDGVRPPFFDQH